MKILLGRTFYLRLASLMILNFIKANSSKISTRHCLVASTITEENIMILEIYHRKKKLILKENHLPISRGHSQAKGLEPLNHLQNLKNQHLAKIQSL